MNSPNTLTITGDLTFNNNSTVLVSNGGCIHVEGDFLNKNNSGDVEIFGTLMIDGDFTNGTGSGMGAEIDVGSTGSITYGGSCSNPGTVEDNNGTYSGDCNNPVLPVELLNFRATAIELGNLLQWETASERNNDFFEIHRSANTQNWERIGKLNGAGNSDQIIAYQYLDHNPLHGRVFYRLKQVDFDGAYEYSYIISVVTGELPQFEILRIFPNPTPGGVEINYVSNNDSPVLFRVIDPTGKTIDNGKFNNNVGSNTILIDLNPQDHGVFMLLLENRGFTRTAKILKHK